MVDFHRSLEGFEKFVCADGFFAGWPNRPSDEKFLSLLDGSAYVALAVDRDADRVIGFATAVSDGVFAGFIPLLEVLPDWRGQGIGHRLIEMLMEDMAHCYSVDVVCDEGLTDFYKSLGFMDGPRGMVIRRRENV